MADLTAPDLLFSEPAPRFDLQRLERIVSFCYAAGDSGGALDEFLDVVALPESAFVPECFERDIFLEELVRAMFAVTLAGHSYDLPVRYVQRVVSRPPRAQRDVEWRQEALAALLASDELRTQLAELYQRLAALRQHLEAGDPSNPVESIRRRLDLLEDLRGCVLQLKRFDGQAAGLGAWARWSQAQSARVEFQSLNQLLDFEANLSSMDLSVSVGADGRLRGFEIVKLEENSHNRFYVSPWRRLWTRMTVWMRGYRFGEHELLSRLVDQVFGAFEAQVAALLQLGLDVGVLLGQLEFRERARHAGLELSQAALVERGAGSEVCGLFNPLLLAHGVSPVPCDVRYGGQQPVVVVTGPNSGGKTRLLQALAFAQLLAEGGWLVPAQSARVERAGGLFASLIDEPAAGQCEGRLGSELLRIRRVFEHARPGALVLLDELCSGTNPSEGEQLFQLVVDLLFELHPSALVTTHFLELAQRLAAQPETLLGFLQVELDPQLAPTFRFVPGVASTSLAGSTAARLGVTRDELLLLIRRHSALAPPKPPKDLGDDGEAEG